MRTKTKNRVTLLVAVLAATSACSAAGVSVFRASAQEAAAATKTATFVEATSKFGCNWEQSPYGVNGYIVVNGTQ